MAKISRLVLIWFLLLGAGKALADLRLDADVMHHPQLDEASSLASGAMELAFQPSARANGYSQNLDLVLFGRWNERLSKHSHADVREFAYTLASRDYEARVGMTRSFWGVTEGAHLVDIINQEDWLEDVDGEDKLGQPMLSLAWTADWGIWRAYLLPYFRERQFPDRALWPIPFAIAEEEARFESEREQQHLDYAFRWKHYFGGLDVALSWFQGTGREPRLLPCARRGSGRPGTQDQANCDLEEAFAGEEPSAMEELLLELGSGAGLMPSREEQEEAAVQAALADIVLVPHYDQIGQFGLELQWIQGAWAWKFEGRRRQQRSNVRHAAAAGFEYTRSQPFNWPVDFGYVLEYLYDERGGRGGEIAPLNNDLLIAWRALFSDVAGTQFLAGVLQDLDDRGRIYSLEASRRLGDAASIGLELRIYSDLPADDPLGFLADTDRIRLLLSYYL